MTAQKINGLNYTKLMFEFTQLTHTLHTNLQHVLHYQKDDIFL